VLPAVRIAAGRLAARQRRDAHVEARHARRMVTSARRGGFAAQVERLVLVDARALADACAGVLGVLGDARVLVAMTRRWRALGLRCNHADSAAIEWKTRFATRGHGATEPMLFRLAEHGAPAPHPTRSDRARRSCRC
jgi:hypothetical protein